ncbi:hypothetical protein Aargi30884_15310 [Amedibacterium intestinale]|uniref:Uncharacterized protein n=1 Tax=Amedibacterium intestinale TaxID=2583452 RepID=A0A6N4TIE8_9FIRM|nr:hypothetical protein [Amedibacterium intestinale]BBK22628.1 hypothetical protein Aargi30884_15310 [Amedibacterium intestinale]
MSDSGYMTKEMMQGIITIGWQAGTSMVHVLRDVIWRLKIANEKSGESSYKNYLNETKGKKFKDEIDFLRVAEKKKSEVVKASVSKDDVLFLQKTCQRYGVDFHLRTRPENLEELLQKKFVRQEMLTSREDDILKSFIMYDPQGKMMMDPENESIPLLKKDDYLLSFKQTDINKWELICERLEDRNRSIKEKIDKAKQIKQHREKDNQKVERNKERKAEVKEK